MKSKTKRNITNTKINQEHSLKIGEGLFLTFGLLWLGIRIGRATLLPIWVKCCWHSSYKLPNCLKKSKKTKLPKVSVSEMWCTWNGTIAYHIINIIHLKEWEDRGDIGRTPLHLLGHHSKMHTPEPKRPRGQTMNTCLSPSPHTHSKEYRAQGRGQWHSSWLPNHNQRLHLCRYGYRSPMQEILDLFPVQSPAFEDGAW